MDCVPDIPLEEVFIDSPILRERIQAVQTDLDDFCQELRKLHSTAKLYIQAGQTFARLGQALADEMLSFKVRRCEGDESPRFQHFMMQMGSVTKEIESARQILFYETEKFLLKPIEYFLISEYEECKESRRNYEKTRATYDSFVEKNCTTPGKKEKFRQEYEDHRLQLSDMTFDYVRIMTEFEKRKRFEFMERMALYAQENIRFLETGLSQLNTIRPQFEELHQFCQKEKDSLDTLRVDAVEKRRKKIIRQKSVMYLMKTPKKVTKEGYLYKKSRNISIKDWNRRYFVISNGHMFYYRQHKDNEPQGTINLMLTTVKEVNTNDHTYCMEVISNQRAYVLQAESLQELRDWISVIQNCTATLLEAQTIGHATASDEDDPLYNLWAAHPKNRECVDCGARDPDWVSINLGVLMCIGCSGIHRSLGVHISKVRSLTLDRCDPQLLEFMKAIGNHFANSVFEAGVVTKLTDSSNRSEKQSYIHDKYVGKKFVPRFSGSQEELDEEFYRSMVDGDVRKAYNLLAYGANLDSARNPTGNAPIFTAISSKNAVCIDLLLLNDADLRAHDKTGFTPIHSAVQTMDLAILQQVLSRGGRYDQPCGPGPYERMTPLDIASSIGFTEAVRILKTHKTGTDLDTIDGDGAGDLAASSRARPSFADSPAIAVLSVGDKSRSTSLNTSRPASESTGFFRRFSPHE